MSAKLSDEQISKFIRDGYLKLEEAFSPIWAQEGRAILWNDTRCDPDDASTWTQPVIRLGYYNHEPFKKAVNTPFLHTAFDQLAGEGNWIPRNDLGTFPVRFPHPADPGDTGWHVDASFPGDDVNNFMSWRININSQGRALLMLFLFSDIEETDAPTRIKVGSHLDVAAILKSAGETGLTFMELTQQLNNIDPREEILATGKAGTVYLCHPFLAHAAQPHRGKNPRFLAQPPLGAKKEFNPLVPSKSSVPVEIAIQLGLNLV